MDKTNRKYSAFLVARRIIVLRCENGRVVTIGVKLEDNSSEKGGSFNVKIRNTLQNICVRKK